MRLAYAALLACISLTGCQTTAQPMVNSFDPAAAAFSQGSGSGAVVGQAFARQVGGGVVTAAGSPVLLVPDQPFTRELVSRRVNGQFAMGEEDPVRPFARDTTADASGSFRFTGIPSGQYIALSTVSWGVPTQYGVMPQGGWVAAPVTVQSGSISEVILNR